MFGIKVNLQNHGVTFDSKKLSMISNMLQQNQGATVILSLTAQPNIT